MSPRRIIIGLAIGVCFLAASLAAIFCWSLPTWLLPAVLIGVPAIAVGILSERRRRKALQHYWQRVCRGALWRRRFPDSPKSEIREFFDVFLDAFAFSAPRRLCFSPDDKVLEVYHALYPPGDALADCLELETFSAELRKHYIDLVSLWRDDLTLGELYARIHKVA